MTYELALQLKEAGFPIHEFNGEPADRHSCTCGEYERDECKPTLSELIESCGSSFYELRKLGYEYTNSAPMDGFIWEASSPDVTPMLYVGNTPEEAVARLYLALNKK